MGIARMAVAARGVIVREFERILRMRLTSPAFSPGDFLPRRFAKEHGNISPPLKLSEIPPEAQSLALIMSDPDAPSGTFMHWVLFNIPPKTTEIRENQSPPGAVSGKNDYGDIGYGGPRPPSGTHRYFFNAYALDTPLALPPGASAAEVERAMETHVLENSKIMGQFSAT